MLVGRAAPLELNHMSDAHSDIKPITQAAPLLQLCDKVKTSGWCAFDTEFVGEDQFKPEVCLIQIAIDGECALVDPLSGLDVAPIWELVADPGILKLVHAGSEDIAQCREQIGKPPAKVFDLQIAAGFIGHDYPISLSRLVQAATGEKLAKSHTLSDWRKRPLSEEQLHYAVEDVVHLRGCFDHIDKRLKKLGREQWLWEECDALCRSASTDEEEVQKLKRLKGAGSLSAKELAIAHALLEARETLARQYNRPARAVLRDHLLVEIARRGLTDVQKMRTLRGLNLSTQSLQSLAEVVSKAKKLPSSAWPELPSQEDSNAEQVLISLLTAVLQDFCAANDLAYSLLSKKQHLRNFVRTYTRPDDEVGDNALAAGWRKVAVGELLDGILRGHRSVRVEFDDKKNTRLRLG